MPLVSVVMPTLNSARHLREAVHSLINQDYPRFELIVVDGGSTDGTLDILKSYLGDEDLKILELPPDQGIAKALNVGLAEARGEFIARMDADDVSYPSRLTAQVEFLVQNPEVGFAGAGIENFGARAGRVLRPHSHDDIRDSFLTSNPFYHSTVITRVETH
jgi:glycosyltransferase involved in cell wall biosynthesis